MLSKMVVDKAIDAIGHKQDAALGLFPVGTALAVDNKPPLLPLYIFFFEIGKFAHSKAGVQKGPNDKFLIKGVTGVGEQVDFVVA